MNMHDNTCRGQSCHMEIVISMAHNFHGKYWHFPRENTCTARESTCVCEVILSGTVLKITM